MAGDLAFAQLAAGHYHTCGVDTAGQAWCWGNDTTGQLGDGDDGQADEYAPVQVVGGRTFAELTADGLRTCGIDSTDKAWCWGYDADGQLGDGNDGQANEYAPVAVAGALTFRHLAVGNSHTCGIDADGYAWCWGDDTTGQLGDGNDGQADEYTPVKVVSGLTFANLSAGYGHTCRVDTTGKGWCWGDDTTGQLGDGDDGQANEYGPVPMVGDRTFAHLSAGDSHTCGVGTTGKGWCVGDDSFGQLGDGNDGQATEYTPVPVAGIHTFATTL